MSIFNVIIYQPIYNLLIFLYSILWNDLGLAIIAITIIIKLLLTPLSKKQIESQKELQKVQPKIKEIQKKYKDDREKQSKEMLNLYKEHKINPASGCLPLIVQMVVFMTMYRIISNLTQGDNFQVHLESLYSFVSQSKNLEIMFLNFLNLKNPSISLAVITAGFQFYQLKMMQQKSANKKVEKQEVIKKENQNPDMTEIMNKQMLVIVPMMTLFIGIKFASGLALYWLTSTIFSIIQQWIIMHKEEKSNKL